MKRLMLVALLSCLCICCVPNLIDPVGNSPVVSSSGIRMGVNISWFNSWHETQQLANVALTSRSLGAPIAVDEYGNPTGDFTIMVYEGNNPGGLGAGGGAQFGKHLCRFSGQADITYNNNPVGEKSYDPASNVTTFSFTTPGAENTFLAFSNTRRFSSDAAGTGVRNLEIMRPGHVFGDFLNTQFVRAMEPFSAFRVGPNWDEFIYSTGTPAWNGRAKPAGIFSAGENASGTAPWEVLARMANEMDKDVWICIPANAEDDYIRDIIKVFYYGSDGDEPYSTTQENPVWRPLDSDRALYIEVGNEVWNSAAPYGTATNQMQALAEAELAAGDPYHYAYAPSDISDNLWYGIRRRLAQKTWNVSRICREVVGDANMMTRYRPIIAGQGAYPWLGQLSLSYLKCVYGGHEWYTAWAGDGFPGAYVPGEPATPEDGEHVNQFGNIARPLSYWIYGYAAAFYVNGGSSSALMTDFNDNRKGDMLSAIEDAHAAGVEALAYEGGIETYHNYDDPGLQDVIESMISYWRQNNGGLFMYTGLAGNNGLGIYPDLTRQDPAHWPKGRAVRKLAGLE